MPTQLHNELKKEFQLERLILFSDAVFAIAITLLVIEIKVPEIEKEHLTEQSLRDGLGHLIPKFIGFLVSFAVIGIYWTVHHRMFGFVTAYTPKLLRLNLIFLFAVALMPFSTGFYSEYLVRYMKTPMIMYSLNICFLGLMTYLMWRHISNPKNNISEGISKLTDKLFRLRSIMVPAIFVLFAIIYITVDPQFAAIIPAFVPLFVRIGVKWIEKNYEKKYGNVQQ